MPPKADRALLCDVFSYKRTSDPLLHVGGRGVKPALLFYRLFSNSLALILSSTSPASRQPHTRLYTPPHWSVRLSGRLLQPCPTATTVQSTHFLPSTLLTTVNSGWELLLLRSQQRGCNLLSSCLLRIWCRPFLAVLVSPLSLHLGDN